MMQQHTKAPPTTATAMINVLELKGEAGEVVLDAEVVVELSEELLVGASVVELPAPPVEVAVEEAEEVDEADEVDELDEVEEPDEVPLVSVTL